MGLVVCSGGFGGGVCGCGAGAQGEGVWRRRFFFGDIFLNLLFLNLPLLICLSCCICLRLVVGEVVRLFGGVVGVGVVVVDVVVVVVVEVVGGDGALWLSLGLGGQSAKMSLGLASGPGVMWR